MMKSDACENFKLRHHHHLLKIDAENTMTTVVEASTKKIRIHSPQRISVKTGQQTNKIGHAPAKLLLKMAKAKEKVKEIPMEIGKLSHTLEKEKAKVHHHRHSQCQITEKAKMDPHLTILCLSATRLHQLQFLKIRLTRSIIVAIADAMENKTTIITFIAKTAFMKNSDPT